MEVQNEISSISFTYFASHEGVEDIILKEQSEKGIPATKSQRFFADSAKVDRKNLIQRIETLVTLIIVPLIFNSFFVISCCAALSVVPLTKGGLELFSLFESYTQLVKKDPPSLAVVLNKS